MENFVKIADGLDVGPALAEIDRASDHWIHLNADPLRFIMLISGPFERQLEAELAESWRLIDRVLDILAADPHHQGRLHSARIGLIPPGAGLPVHRDGIDGVRWRRYQIALRSDPGVVFAVDGEEKRFLPGEAWQFHAGRMHYVRNDSDADRITILVDTIARG
jgi:aspartyl/asparaginyl beta-hydroxylase (cupin superfamily)